MGSDVAPRLSLGGWQTVWAVAACLRSAAITRSRPRVAMPHGLAVDDAISLRLISGLALGGFVVGCPLYLAEIAPRALRGRFVGWFQVQIGFGAVLAFAVSALLAPILQR